MEPNGPSRSIYWLEPQGDICWVQMAHVLAKVEVATSASGRQYHLTKNESTIAEMFPEKVQHSCLLT